MGWRLEQAILAENHKRARILTLVVTLLHLPLLGVDLWRQFSGQLSDHDGYRYLFYLHLFLVFVLVTIYVYLAYHKRRYNGEPTPVSRSVVAVGVVLVLYTAAAISLADQLIHGQISVYLLAAGGIAITIYLPFGLSILLFGSGYLLFALLLPMAQPNPDIVTGHFINATLLTGVVIAANVSLYRHALRGVRQMRVIEEQKDDLARLAWVDELTGLANRRFADMRLAEETARFVRYKRPFSLCMGDLDRFKQVNDRFSHSVGDQVLQTVAYLLSAQLREVDMVARYGGEEFVLVLPETNAEDATEVCEKLRAGIEAYDWDQLQMGLEVTISFGVADSSSAKESSEVLKQADRRLYQAKAAGRNRVRGAGYLNDNRSHG